MIKVLKAICVGTMAGCIISIMISVCLFSTATIDLTAVLLLFGIFLLIGIVFLFGYLTCEHIEETNKKWMELGKKKKSISEYPPTAKRI